MILHHENIYNLEIEIRKFIDEHVHDLNVISISITTNLNSNLFYAFITYKV